MLNKIDYDLRNYSEEEQRAFSIKNHFIPDEDFYTFLKTLTTLCPKLILAGSVGLHVTRVSIIDDWKKRSPDLDFSLTEPLDEYEFDQILSLLELTVISGDHYDDDVSGYDENLGKPTTSQILKQNLIRLWYEKLSLYIDIFNYNYNNGFKVKNNENIYFINFPTVKVIDRTKSYWDQEHYTPHLIPVQHPAVTISHKMKYAFFPNYGKRKKHKNDCIDFLCKDHNGMLKTIQELDKKKIEFAKALRVKYKSLTEIQEPEIKINELPW